MNTLRSLVSSLNWHKKLVQTGKRDTLSCIYDAGIHQCAQLCGIGLNHKFHLTENEKKYAYQG